MQATLFANLSSLTLSPSLTGGAFSWPKIVAGSDLVIGLRFAENLGGTVTEIPRTLSALKVSLGKADARPVSGTFKLHLGDDPAEDGVNVTAELDYDVSAADLQTALNALTGVSSLVPCTVDEITGGFRIRFADASAEVSIAAVENKLYPVAFIEAWSVQQSAEYIHELRLVQTPVAQTVDFAEVAADAPSITEVQAGGSNEDITWNEIQKLYIPPDFRGSFQIRRGYKKSEPIGLPTTADDISTALEALADDDSEFIVTEVDDGVLIEFSGDMGGTDQALLTVQVLDQPAGDPTFTLHLDTAEVWTAMTGADSRTGELKLPLEIKLWLEDEEGDEDDHPFIFRPEITLILPVDQGDRDASSEIQWNQPRGKRATLPFTPGQVLVGNRSYSESLGDDSATEFTINHNLDTPSLQIAVRENATDGRLLACPQDYNISFDSDNALTITPQAATISGGVLTADQWVIVITAADEAIYQAHEHPIEEVTGLRDELDALGAALTTLQDLVPTGALASRDVASGTPVMETILPTLAELYPSRTQLTLAADATLADILPASLPRDGGLVPAVHDATTTDIEDGVLPDIDTDAETGNVGEVFINAGTTNITVPGGGGRRSVSLLPGQAVANDGTRWYRVAQIDAGETSWYPTDFDRELFVLAINSKMLIAKRTAELFFGFEAALRSVRESKPAQYAWDTLKNTRGQWQLVIEHGAFTSESSPSTTAANLKAITWDTTPILTQTIILTQAVTRHTFGARIIRDSAGDLTAEASYYGASEASESVPASADFALRARLIRFDIEDGISDPKGLVMLRGLNVSLLADDASSGKLVIK